MVYFWYKMEYICNHSQSEWDLKNKTKQNSKVWLMNSHALFLPSPVEKFRAEDPYLNYGET